MSKKPYLLFFVFIAILNISCNKNIDIDFNTIDLTDLKGKPVNLENYKNSTVFVNFWGTWCRPCIKEMPRIADAKEKLAKHNYKFVFISDEDLSTLNKFVNKNNFDFDFYHSKEKLTDLGINTFPTTVILNKDLEKISSIKGEQRWDSNGHIKLLKQYADAR